MNARTFAARFLQAAGILTLIVASVNAQAQGAPPAPPAAATDVPVTEVVLFSSGVGYFQHEGTVHGDAATELRFKTGQINDILKSLVLNDLDGGHVGVVTYPSQDPLDKTLASFQVNLSDNPGEVELLDKLRGARVNLTYGAETVVGTILGVEQRDVPGGRDGAEPLKRAYLNLVTERGLRSLALTNVDYLQLADRGLQEELDRALAAVAGARDQDKKLVSIRFNGRGDRHVRLGYVVETPIWKASYRLVLPGRDATDKKGLLQGWAIVDNQTDNDWKDVRLSLVSGRPISFIEDLYQPLYVPRPTVVPELYASLRPQEYDGGQASKGEEPAAGMPAAATDEKANDKRATARRRTPDGPLGGALLDAPAPVAMAAKPINVSESVAPLAETSELGELFQYTVGNVTLGRQKSAMIPIINDPVEVEKVSIYNQAVLGTHPLNGARVKNTTEDKKHLLQGPVTVFDDGRYAGDARIDDVGPGETRLLSYGVDLQVGVIPKDLEAKNVVQTGKIVKGVLELKRKYVSAREYSAENKSEEARTLVIEHPLRPGWKLVDTPAPVETTAALYRFQEAVGPGKTEKLIVREENVQNDQRYLAQMNTSGLLLYNSTGEIPLSVREALAKVATRKQALVDLQNAINGKEAEITSTSNDQTRIRENIKSVDRTSAYATRLLKKLDDQETQLDKLHAEVDALRTRKDAQQKEFDEALNNLNVE